MIHFVFIGNDKKFVSVVKMSIPGIKISEVGNSSEISERPETLSPDILVIDLDFTGKDWNQLIRPVLNLDSKPKILVTGTCGDTRIIEAVKMGASDFIGKPVTKKDLKKLKYIIDSIIRDSLKRHKTVDSPEDLDKLIGESESIREIKNLIAAYGPSDAPVLLTGESGVGKNLIAELIHTLSSRKNNPYISINAAALPLSLVESELYGTIPGAYTGAVPRAGWFETADTGTLFLDEIGEMDTVSQVKILRIIEDKKLSRLGGNKLIPIDVRLVTATNKNIAEAVRNKTFRKDLYYRISTLRIDIPPLRKRKEDIPLLVKYFLLEEDPEVSITDNALLILTDHNWPGNIRELKNTLIRSCILSMPDKIIKIPHIRFDSIE